MVNSIIYSRFEVYDTLYSDEAQTIYLVKDLDKPELGQLIFNEFGDIDLVYRLEECLLHANKDILKNIVEWFKTDLKFCLIGKISNGNTLGNFLSQNNLRLADKMFLTENFLSQLQEMDAYDAFFKFALCDSNCLSVAGTRVASFNINFRLNKAQLDIGATDFIKRVGFVILAIFSNTVNIDEESFRDNLPPAINNIISKCKAGQFASTAEILKEFKSSLLFTTFFENTTIDNQLAKNIKRANRKIKYGFFKKAAAVLLILVISAGGIYAWLTKPENSAAVMNSKNNAPTAEFAMSSNKIYTGDEVIFTNMSIDSDINDNISKQAWTVEKENKQIGVSYEKDLRLRFAEPGNYAVTLLVSDKNGASGTYSQNIVILARPDIPAPTGAVTGTGVNK